MDELVVNATQIQDIEPYSPVHSVNWDEDDDDNEQNLEDDIDILSNDNTSVNNDNHTNSYFLPKNFYQLTYPSEDAEGQIVDEHDISELLECLILHIEKMIIEENQEKYR